MYIISVSLKGISNNGFLAPKNEVLDKLGAKVKLFYDSLGSL